jgi:hypothetical protein
VEASSGWVRRKRIAATERISSDGLLNALVVPNDPTRWKSGTSALSDANEQNQLRVLRNEAVM